MSFRVLVTGSRDWPNPNMIRELLDDLLWEHGELTVVHGDARGADKIASSWCTDTMAVGPGLVTEERWPAQWDKHGKAAGIIRNGEMVSQWADVCLAFFTECALKKCTFRDKHYCHGTTNCALLADNAGITVRRFYA